MSIPSYKSESEVSQSCLTLCNPMNCSLPGSSVHGISQNSTGVDCRFLLRGIFQPRDWTQVSRSIDRCFTIWATREVGTTQFCSGFFSPLSLTEVTQEKLKQFQCVSPWFYLNEDSSLKRYKSILYEWPNFYWFIHHCIKIPYFTEKVQAAKFQFSLQHKTRLYLQVDVSTSIDVLQFNQWLGNPTSHAGGPKKQTKAVWLRVSTSLCWAEEKYSAFQRIVLTGELGGSFPASLVVCHWFCLFSLYG